MPYLRADDRARIDAGAQPRGAGELNYALTRLVQRFIADNGDNYEARNAAIGALECCKLELYRRNVAPYEDGKARLNGDVYEPAEEQATCSYETPDPWADLVQPFTTSVACRYVGKDPSHALQVARILRAHGYVSRLSRPLFSTVFQTLWERAK